MGFYHISNKWGKLYNHAKGVPGGGVSIRSTVAPAINAAAVIGTQITGDNGTWTGAPTLTYQWQRNTGTWGNIAGATNKNYTPVDASFGYALRLAVTPNGNAALTAYSNATNLVIEAPAQSLSGELVTNGNMETGSPPSNWTAFSSSILASAADERTGGAGSASLSAKRGTNDLVARNTATTVSATALLLAYVWVKNIDATSVNPSILLGGGATTLASIATTSWVPLYGFIRTAGQTSMEARVYLSGSSGQEVRADDFSIKPVTPNSQLTAPSANMRLDQMYSLPTSPIIGSQIWLVPRISDWDSGNYWRCTLTYTGSQWNINLYSVATFTATSRIAATNIGATNGIRINANGDSISLYTTADNGANWTQRGTTITNSTYNTATGVNAIWTSDFTAGQLIYAAAS